jgi:hypothetical protein
MILKLFSHIWLYLEEQFHLIRIRHPKLLKLLWCVPLPGLTPVFGLLALRGACARTSDSIIPFRQFMDDSIIPFR